ncbi:NIPSNAP family protein [Paracoccidioides lutzii Pb01]|uniref:NIPSNAP family protein n=1 Tax=Paracoccidioides lutzii (strain ATCC MYA-826 / Pb01) TaxID=502779 RepID=C1H5B9_PARBA|nr:NIPSNAP family protein [Paracoccidioides lutzii Pb01]EEH34913.1 NIPSNAP family protein [Paracoccidioides lutzii Pb01]
MLAPRLLRSSSASPQAWIRSLCTTAALCRAPSIRDITPDTAASFNARQKEFRENLEAARRKKEQQESQLGDASVSPASFSFTSRQQSGSTHPTAPGMSNVSGKSDRAAAGVAVASATAASNDAPTPLIIDAAETLDVHGLSSLSTHRIVGEHRQSETSNTPRRGTLSSLIYGTKEGQQLDKDIERSFSEVLARGKYVHSIVFHEVKPDKVDEYVDLVGQWYPKMAQIENNKVHLVGSWRTQVGDNDTFVHIWEYQRYSGYHASLHAISEHPEFRAFDRRLKSLINSKRTSLMQEFSFWPTTPPRKLGGLFELRSYTLHPGNLLEWETHWRRGLHARREVMEGVGAWFVQIGELNTVHHLWQFADLEERKIRREKSWSIEGWADTVHKTVPLIQTMKSRILIPMPWSPVG